MDPYRAFTVHLRCANCVKPSSQQVVVPRVEDAPSTVDEFIESAALSSIKFCCKRCESTVAVMVAVTMEGQEITPEEVELPPFYDVA